MRLTVCLLKNIKELPYRFRGKYRIVKDPKFIDLVRLRNDLEREETNMLILRHPYLTPEQSSGHMKDVVKVNVCQMDRDLKNAKFSKRITLEDRLNHFRVTESWE